MKTYLFHLMPYAALDLDYTEKHNASWVTLPNSYFDPIEGHALYNRYLDELEYGEELGFDGVCVNEHHQNAYGIMPSPVVMAAALSRRTRKADIAILGNAFNLREHPLTLAEEHAMIDCITGGRLISGMVRGIGCEYYSMGVNPTSSLERFYEAHDLVIRAWTEEGPFAFEGKHYHFEYVNVWPRPYRKPHPPIWCPSLGSAETIRWTSHPDRKYVYLQTFSPFASVTRFLNAYRLQAEEYGYTASQEQLGWAAPVYVAETDEQAMKEAAPHVDNFFNKFLNFTAEMLLPPGYMSTDSLKRVRQHKSQLSGSQTPEVLNEQGVVLVGSPDTIRKRLTEYHREVNLGYFLPMLQFATLPPDLTHKSMELFADEVMPALRELDGSDAKDPVKGFEMPASQVVEMDR